MVGARDHLERLVLVGVERERAQGRGHAVGEFAHGLARRVAVLSERNGGDGYRLAEVEQRAAAEGGLRGVVESGGDDLQIERRARGGGAERDAGRARLQRLQRRLRVRLALGADGERAAAPQKLRRALERLAVLRGVLARVLLAVDGDRLHRADERADDRRLEERGLGEERDAARRVAEDEHGIDQPVRVVQDEDGRAAAGHALAAHHLDAPEEDAQREAQHGDQHASRQSLQSPSENPSRPSYARARAGRFTAAPPRRKFILQ
jgi:hypothetical protein